MLQRPALIALQGDDVTLDLLLEHLRGWRADTVATRATMQTLREGVEGVTRQLENPRAAFEYLEFFSSMFDRVIGELDTVLAVFPGEFTTEHADTLRQIASNGAVEQRRTVIFRDKWVNKPLPYEQVRPLLTQIAGDVRDQLNDYKDLTLAAARITQLVAPPAPPDPSLEKGFDRRALFTKLIKPLGDED